ncbi:MAG: Nitronate monooxygenase [Candidatus Methanoperedenaceae archaeon GB50]|nr:MAG: Nitronate monooxygenase [Candidatus Methanoperedenaceae archaeon GB50]
MAGGVYTGQDIARFLNLGASGVQMATRFVVTEECDASEAFKKEHIRAKKEDIVFIKSPVGMPGRAIKNKFLEEVERGKKVPFKCLYHCIKTCVPRKAPYCISSALINAQKGNLEEGFAFAGSNAYRSNKIVTVKELIEELLEGIKRHKWRKNWRFGAAI